MTMKFERHINRKPDRDIGVAASDPLTAEERAKLTREVMNEFLDLYEKRALAFMAGDDVELENNGRSGGLRNLDIRQDGYLLFHRALEKFDKGPYKGSIAEVNVPGAANPKTLTFYFMVWARKEIFNSLGMVKKENAERLNETTYSNIEIDDDIEFEVVAEKSISHVIELIAANSPDIESPKIQMLAHMMSGNSELIRFFFLKYYHRHTIRELRFEFGVDKTNTYNELSNRIRNSVKSAR